MTEEQIEMLRRLIQDEIEVAGIEMLRRLIQDEIEVAGVDGMEHGVWGHMDSSLDKRWKQFQESFNEEQALKALDKLYQENENGMKELADE